MIWGLISERFDIRYASMMMFSSSDHLRSRWRAGQLAIYIVFLFTVSLGRSLVLQELIWATYFWPGSRSLGARPGHFVYLRIRRRRRAVLRFCHDVTGSYHSSFYCSVVCARVFRDLERMVPRRARSPFGPS